MTRIFCQKGNEKFWIDTFTKDVSIVVNVGVDSSLLWLPIVSRPTMISQQQQQRASNGAWQNGRDNGHLSHHHLQRSLEKPVTHYFVTATILIRANLLHYTVLLCSAVECCCFSDGCQPDYIHSYWNARIRITQLFLVLLIMLQFIAINILSKC